MKRRFKSSPPRASPDSTKKDEDISTEKDKLVLSIPITKSRLELEVIEEGQPSSSGCSTVGQKESDVEERRETNKAARQSDKTYDTPLEQLSSTTGSFPSDPMPSLNFLFSYDTLIPRRLASCSSSVEMEGDTDEPVVSRKSSICQSLSSEGSKPDDELLLKVEEPAPLTLSPLGLGYTPNLSLLSPSSHPSVCSPLPISSFPRSPSLPNMKLQSSFKEFTPDFSDDEGDGIYWFRCSTPGLYQCRESGLVFDMRGEGDVSYRIVPWDRRLLSQHGKKPAGPLFDISCQQQSVAKLHLPHCEIRSTGGCNFLSVAHIHDEDIEFIRPERITETHLIISITGFSPFGNVKDEDSPPDPIRALVLLFYKPPVEPSVRSFLNVLLLPKNIMILDVKRTRKKLFGLETFLDVPPNCKLRPNQLYTLSTDPGEDSVLVQPTEAEFDAESYDCLTLISVTLKSIIGDIELSLKEKSDSSCVWEGHVCLLPQRLKTGLTSDEQLKETRTKIIDKISEPVLHSLLDRLLGQKVLTDSESDFIRKEGTKSEKARVLVDTVKNKGDQASSEMFRFLCELDPYFCRNVGLVCEKPEPNQ